MVAAVMLALALVGAGSDGSDSTIVLQIVRTTPARDEVLEAMVEEAAAIWAPYHVALSHVLTAERPDEPQGKWITVVFRNEPANRRTGEAPKGRRAIASLVFVDNAPGDVMYVSFDTALQTVRSTSFAKGAAGAEERLAARLLGRAIAHELGHYLLASRDHSKDGLMRASFGWQDSTSTASRQFRLSADQAARITRGGAKAEGLLRPSN